MRTHSVFLSAAPEFQLLLCCARVRPAEGSRERVGILLQQDIAWEDILRLADRHRLRSLLSHYLGAVPPALLPSTVQTTLRHCAHAARLRDHLLNTELLALLSLFGTRNIPALPYKGPAFAAQVYENTALRPCSDLDLLVRPEDVLTVKQLLLERGYQPQQHFQNASEEEAHLRTDCEYNFSRSRDGLLVEIHWRIRPSSFPLALEMEELWNRRKTTVLDGMTISVPSLEDTLLLLCIHGAKHRWERLLWVCDVAETLRALSDQSGTEVWPSLTAHADRLGCRRILLLGLLLARDLLEAPVPDSILASMPLAVSALARQVSQQLSDPSDYAGSALTRALFHLGVRERLRDQLPYVKDRLHREAEDRRRNYTQTAQRRAQTTQHKEGGEKYAA